MSTPSLVAVDATNVILQKDTKAATSVKKAHQAVVDYLHATFTAPTPTPVPTPTGADAVFQASWDTTQPKPRPVNGRVVTVTTFSALTATWDNRQFNDIILAKGVVWSGRFDMSGNTPVWLDFDSNCMITSSVGVRNLLYGQGLWANNLTNATITGFLKIRKCTNEGLLFNGASDCYFEVDIDQCDGTGVLLDSGRGSNSSSTAVADQMRNTIKAKLGSNGLGSVPSSPTYNPDLDPHAQKGTGDHAFNAWDQTGGRFILDIHDQPYGAGCETTNVRNSSLAIRAENLTADRNVLPPAPAGFTQTCGNVWQPWGYNNRDNVIECLIGDNVTQGVSTESQDSVTQVNNIVKYAKITNNRVNPALPVVPGVTYQVVQ